MTDREQYDPGPARGVEVRNDGEKWTLILVRELRHPPEKVWQALTEPAHLREWAPFEVDGNLGTAGTTVKLTWVGTATPLDTTVTRRRSGSVTSAEIRRRYGLDSNHVAPIARVSASRLEQYNSKSASCCWMFS